MNCFFARFADTDCMHRADGLSDRAHLVTQQRIRHAGEKRGWSASKIAEATWDERCVVPACRRHHGNFDGKIIRLGEGQYPKEFREWAAEHGFYWAGSRRGWVAEFQPPEEAA